MESAHASIREEAARVVSRVSRYGYPEQVKTLVAIGCIRPLCINLSALQDEIVDMCLTALLNILKVSPWTSFFSTLCWALSTKAHVTQHPRGHRWCADGVPFRYLRTGFCFGQPSSIETAEQLHIFGWPYE